MNKDDLEELDRLIPIIVELAQLLERDSLYRVNSNAQPQVGTRATQLIPTTTDQYNSRTSKP